MRDLRMPKGWKHIGTNTWSDEKTEAEKRLHRQRVFRFMRNCKRLTADQLFKEGENAKNAQDARKASYDAAVKAGKIKKPIKKAR